MKREKIDMWTKSLRGLLESKDVSGLVLSYYLLSGTIKEQFADWVNIVLIADGVSGYRRLGLPIKNYHRVAVTMRERHIWSDELGMYYNNANEHVSYRNLEIYKKENYEQKT